MASSGQRHAASSLLSVDHGRLAAVADQSLLFARSLARRWASCRRSRLAMASVMAACACAGRSSSADRTHRSLAAPVHERAGRVAGLESLRFGTLPERRNPSMGAPRKTSIFPTVLQGPQHHKLRRLQCVLNAAIVRRFHRRSVADFVRAEHAWHRASADRTCAPGVTEFVKLVPCSHARARAHASAPTL